MFFLESMQCGWSYLQYEIEYCCIYILPFSHRSGKLHARYFHKLKNTEMFVYSMIMACLWQINYNPLFSLDQHHGGVLGINKFSLSRLILLYAAERLS